MRTTRRDFLQRGAQLTTTVAAAGLLRGTANAWATDAAGGKVRVGIFGTTHSHASGKTAALRRLTDLYEVVGVVEPDEKRAAAVEKHADYRGLQFLTEDQLLNAPGLQAIVVETAVRDLVPTATRFASAGLNLHVEKPGGPSLPAFANLLDIVRQKGRVLQMGYMFRRNPAFEFCFRAAREGWLGEIYEIDAVMGKTAGTGERNDMAQFPGGTMFELGCHLIDAMVTLLGKPVEVHSFLRATHPQRDNLSDNALAVCEYANATATIRSDANDVEGNARRSFKICGDRGTATILPLEPPKLTLTLAEAKGQFAKGTQDIVLPKMPGRFDDHLSDFARIILGQKKLDYPPEHDLMVLETVLRASGMPVT